MASLLEHAFRILSRAHNPHHHVVACRGLCQQQGWAQAHPAKNDLLISIHGHRHQIGVVATGEGRLTGRCCRWGRLRFCAIGLGAIGAVGLGTVAARPATTTAATTAARGTGFSSTRGKHLRPSGGRRAHQAGEGGQGLEGVFARQHRHMAKATAAGAGATKQLIDVLTLAFAGQLHQAKLRELGDLGAGAVMAHGLGEMLQQLQLVAARLHVDEVDNHHATDVAQLELTGNLNGRFTVGPQHRLAGIGRAGEGARVHVDHREGLGGLDDHVTPRGQVHPGLQGISDGSVDPEVLEDFGVIAVVLHLQSRLVSPQERLNPAHGVGTIHHNPDHVRGIEIAKHPMDEVLIPVEQHRRARRFSRRLNPFPLAQQVFKVVDQELFANAFGLGTNQQARARGLDQHPKGPQAIAFVFAVNSAGNVHPLAVGLQHQKPTRQGQIARESGPFGARGLLHHLHQNLLARLE